MPRADLVLFVTSADRPFTETERAFLETIRGWGKKIVVVINKIDIFERRAEVDEVIEFVRASAQRLLGMTPEIFPVSARLAQRAKSGAPASWAASGFEALETFIAETLHESSRFRLKLANPLGVGQALAHRYATIADERLTLLTDDVAVLEQIDRQLAVYSGDSARGFELRMTAVEKVLVDMEVRGHDYFEDTLRLARVVDLLNRARVQKEFEERVVGDAPRQSTAAATRRSICRGASPTTRSSNSFWTRDRFRRSMTRPMRSVSSKYLVAAPLHFEQHLLDRGHAQLEAARQIFAVDRELAFDVLEQRRSSLQQRQPLDGDGRVALRRAPARRRAGWPSSAGSGARRRACRAGNARAPRTGWRPRAPARPASRAAPAAR